MPSLQRKSPPKVHRHDATNQHPLRRLHRPSYPICLGHNCRKAILCLRNFSSCVPSGRASAYFILIPAGFLHVFASSDPKVQASTQLTFLLSLRQYSWSSCAFQVAFSQVPYRGKEGRTVCVQVERQTCSKVSAPPPSVAHHASHPLVEEATPKPFPSAHMKPQRADGVVEQYTDGVRLVARCA
ncbi:hypothetical protein BJ165DRAFT_1468207 [Panaeolus papilionaceus]|nr:hypothetical protein BJ165DRAFT_1468207 [Panaeolus papilionaceus]